MSFGREEPLIDGILSRLTTRHDLDHLGDLELPQHFPQIINPSGDTHHHNPINLRMVVKQLQRIDYDRSPLQLQELLRLTVRIHPFTGSSGED